MVSPQPILSPRYFKFTGNRLPKGIKSLFYLSWEDALWDLLSKKKVKRGSYILFPDFYCDDVENNIKSHGYKVGYYHINSDLSANLKSFESAINKNKPSVAIVFHPDGIKSNLMEDIFWLSKITHNLILIEDSVHRAINPKKIKIIKKNHFVIDSLRKVVPIQGARIFGKSDDLGFSSPLLSQSFFYAFKVNFLWMTMIILWTVGSYKLAEKIMIVGYDLIGDSDLPARGSILARFLSERIDVEAINKCKARQVDYYEKCFGKQIPQRVRILKEDKKYLRGFPVVLESNVARKILKFLRKKGLLVRFELNGSDWSKKQKIIYLPLGVTMSEKQQNEVCKLVCTAFQLFKAK